MMQFNAALTMKTIWWPSLWPVLELYDQAHGIRTNFLRGQANLVGKPALEYTVFRRFTHNSP